MTLVCNTPVNKPIIKPEIIAVILSLICGAIRATENIKAKIKAYGMNPNSFVGTFTVFKDKPNKIIPNTNDIATPTIEYYKTTPKFILLKLNPSVFLLPSIFLFALSIDFIFIFVSGGKSDLAPQKGQYDACGLSLLPHWSQYLTIKIPPL